MHRQVQNAKQVQSVQAAVNCMIYSGLRKRVQSAQASAEHTRMEIKQKQLHSQQASG